MTIKELKLYREEIIRELEHVHRQIAAIPPQDPVYDTLHRDVERMTLERQ